jgi:hypothetical protein
MIKERLSSQNMKAMNLTVRETAFQVDGAVHSSKRMEQGYLPDTWSHPSSPELATKGQSPEHQDHNVCVS